MRKKYSILIIPDSGGRIRSYTISQLGIRLLLFIGICIFGGAGWLVFEYGNIINKNLKISALKHENQQLRKKHQKLKLFAQEFNDFKHRTNKIANLLGIKKTQEHPSPKVQVSLSSLSSVHTEPSVSLSSKNPEIILGEKEQKFTPSIYPVNGWISQNFSAIHPGIDFASKLGAPVVSTMDGVVESVNWDETLGNVIKITNNRGFKTVYGHLLRVTILRGALVRCGELIGFVGSTGKSSAPHLHYEIWLNGEVQNPENYLIRR